MAFSKAHRFQPSDYYFSLLCFAFSHPVRIVIVRRLFRSEKLTVKQLTRNIPLDDTTVSQHLKILRDLKLLAFEQKSPHIYYFINPDLTGTQKVMMVLLFLIKRKICYHGVRDLGIISSMRKNPGV